MKKIVVTGGSGFIGSNLIKLLLKKNYYVINIDKKTYSANPYNLKTIKNNKNYKSFNCDINDSKKVFKILNKFKPRGIFNLAAETHVDRSIDSPDKFIKTNIVGLYNLLKTTNKYIHKTKKKIKFIHISTDEVYGDIKSNKRSNEKFAYDPSSPYSASKASADHLVKSFVKTYNFPAVISNCCNNYGPNQFPEKLIPKLIYNIIKNKIFSKGKIGESYNVGSNKNIKNIDIAKKLIQLVKKDSLKIGNKVKIKFVKDRPGHDFRYALNSNKIKKQLKWRAKITFEKGLLNTFNWYLSNMAFFTSVSKKLYINRLGLNKK